MSQQHESGTPIPADPAETLFNGSGVTATTREASAIINLHGYHVSALDIGRFLVIRGGTNFVIGVYIIVTIDSGSNSWQLDRPCSIGVGSGMLGKIVSQAGRWHGPVPEFYEADLPDNPGRGQARQRALEALHLVEPRILSCLAETCLKRTLLDPVMLNDYDWPGPVDYLLWGHVRDAGSFMPPAGVLYGNLIPLKTAIVGWADDVPQHRWDLCIDKNAPVDWIAEAAVQTLALWHRTGRLAKNPRWSNLDLYCYRTLDSDDAMKMFDLERDFDAGAGYVRLAPHDGLESSRLSDRAQRAAKKEYRELGRNIGLTRMQSVSPRYFEWYALRTFLGHKEREIREREFRTPRKGGTGLGIGNPNDGDDLSAIAHGIKKVADLVEFRR